VKTTPDWQFANNAAPDRGAALKLAVRAGLLLASINALVFVAAPMARLYLNIPGTIAYQVFYYATLCGALLAAGGLLIFSLAVLLRMLPGWKGALLMSVLGLLPAIAILGYAGPEHYKGVLLYDITTDTTTAPEFVEAVKQRRVDDHPAAYNAAGLTSRQRTAYPNLGPILSKLTYDDALAEATQVVKDLGWEFMNVDYEKGIIEAYAITPVFGLVDDVIIRVRREGRGSRIDVRSASRRGLGEPGLHAKRIRQFISTFRG
jgi:uncharacterized protein (DUF1499 family)